MHIWWYLQKERGSNLVFKSKTKMIEISRGMIQDKGQKYKRQENK